MPKTYLQVENSSCNLEPLKPGETHPPIDLVPNAEKIQESEQHMAKPQMFTCFLLQLLLL